MTPRERSKGAKPGGSATPRSETQPSRRSAGAFFDATWPRFARVLGVGWALAEWILAWRQNRPPDQNVIAFAASLAVLPSVLARRKE